MDYTPSQVQIFRAVAGAVKNAADGHKDWNLTQTMAHSIAKRATGTLTAQMRLVLAAGPSENARGVLPTQSSGAASLASPLSGGMEAQRGTSLLSAVRAAKRRSPLRTLQSAAGALAGQAYKAGNFERHRALVECLRLIDEQRVRVKA